MGQSRLASILEAVLNIFTGMIIAFTLSQVFSHYAEVIRVYIYSDFTWAVTAKSNMIVTIILTIVSLIRSYIWRRIFNHHHIKRSSHDS